MKTATIWKFPLAVVRSQIVEMPEGAVVLHVRDQDGLVCLWAMVDPLAAHTPRHFEIYGTGHPFPIEARREYLGTALSAGGALVWHVFEVHAVDEQGFTKSAVAGRHTAIFF